MHKHRQPRGEGGVGEVVATAADSNAKLEQAQQVELELKAEVEAPCSGIDSLSLKIQLVFDLHTSTQTCKVQGGEGEGGVADTTNDKR